MLIGVDDHCGRQVASTFSEVLCDQKMADVTHDYLLLINHPSTCANILKVRSHKACGGYPLWRCLFGIFEYSRNLCYYS